MSFDTVIEAHRQAIGASSVHVTLGPEATPEGLSQVLSDLRVQMDHYVSFPEALRRGAEVHRLRKLLDEISRTASDPSRSEADRLRAIVDMTDMVPDVDLDLDIAFMTDAQSV